jgi:hypothetical protein
MTSSIPRPARSANRFSGWPRPILRPSCSATAASGAPSLRARWSSSTSSSSPPRSTGSASAPPTEVEKARIRLVIESVFSNLKQQMRLSDHLAKTTPGLAQRIAQRLLARTLGIFCNLLAGRPPRALVAYAHVPRARGLRPRHSPPDQRRDGQPRARRPRPGGNAAARTRPRWSATQTSPCGRSPRAPSAEQSSRSRAPRMPHARRRGRSSPQCGTRPQP